VGPRTGLDVVKKRKIFYVPGLEVLLLGLTAFSKPLYGFVHTYKGKIVMRE
jgi:hypothetical protein